MENKERGLEEGQARDSHWDGERHANGMVHSPGFFKAQGSTAVELKLANKPHTN